MAKLPYHKYVTGHNTPPPTVCIVYWLYSDAPTTSPTHSPVSTGWRSRSVFSLSWRQSSIVHWTVRLLATWLQIYAVCLICRPDDVWDRHSQTSSMSVSRSVQLLETELSPWLVLDYGTVCHMTSSRVKHCHISVVDSKHFYLDSHILLFCFSS